jgi:hypothetical protein
MAATAFRLASPRAHGALLHHRDAGLRRQQFHHPRRGIRGGFLIRMQVDLG